MKKKLKGGLETIIAVVIVVGIVAALLFTTVIPMSQQGDSLISTTTGKLADQQITIGPK